MKKALSLASALALMSSATFAAANYRAPYAPLGKRAYKIQAGSDYFKSTGYWDNDGVKQSLADGESFSVLNTRLSLMYGYGDNLQFMAGVGYRQVAAQYLANSVSNSITKSGLESYSAGVRYSWKSGKNWFYSLDFQASQTAYSNTDYANTSAVPTDEIILGDAGNSYKVGLGISYLMSRKWIVNMNGTYHQPGNNLSRQIDYTLESSWIWSNLSASLGVDGVYALGADKYTADKGSKPVQGRAPSYLYNSLNHIIVAPKVRVGYGIGSWRIDVYGSKVMAGKSTDMGMHMGLMLTKYSGPAKKTNKTSKSFKEYHVEATVLKVSPKGRFVQIDQGLSQDVEKGMRFDFFETDFFGGNVLVASGIVYEVSLNRAIVKIVKQYSKKKVGKGFTGRAELAK